MSDIDQLALSARLAREVADLAAQYGAPRVVWAALDDAAFDPLTKTDRIGEVCMVIRRTDGRLLTMRKTFYPQGVMRLLTGGVGLSEPIADALLREVAEETSLAVAVRRFLAVIAYTTPASAPAPAFYTFAFLLDELGGELAVQDPEEQVEAFGAAAPAALTGLAAALAALADGHDDAIGGSWGAWGRFRAAAHLAVGDLLRQEPPAITLRPLTPADLPTLFAQQLDPAANHMAAFTAKDPADREAFMAHWARVMADPAGIIRAIEHGGQLAGSVLIHRAFGDPEVSYWLGREHWGRGIATAALAALLSEVAERPLYARVAKDNPASLRVLEKCGFQIYGEDRGFANARGAEIEEWLLRLAAPAA